MSETALEFIDREREVKTFIVRRYHSAPCGGEFLSEGQGMSNAMGTSWLHKCGKCGAKRMFRVVYPDIVHRDAKE